MENFIETIKLKDGKVYQLEYHQRRVNQTFKYFFKQSTVLQLNKKIFHLRNMIQKLIK